MRTVLEEADDEVVDNIRNVEEGKFTCERELPNGVESLVKSNEIRVA